MCHMSFCSYIHKYYLVFIYMYTGWSTKDQLTQTTSLTNFPTYNGSFFIPPTTPLHIPKGNSTIVLLWSMLEGSNKLGACDIYNIVVFNFVTICIIITLVIGIFSICHDIFCYASQPRQPQIWSCLGPFTFLYQYFYLWSAWKCYSH